MMQISQALVAIGGSASRLRSGGVAVPLSKSCLEIDQRPMLYWNLLLMHQAGISRLVLAGDQSLQLQRAELVLDSLPVSFAEVKFFQDPGLGVHGLPHHVAHLIDSACIFECGHSIIEPAHYSALAQHKLANNVVFSAFAPSPLNKRPGIALKDRRLSRPPPAPPNDEG